MTTTNKECYIDFSIDYNGECECVDDFVIENEEVSIDDDVLNPLIHQLSRMEGFFISVSLKIMSCWVSQELSLSLKIKFETLTEKWGFFIYLTTMSHGSGGILVGGILQSVK